MLVSHDMGVIANTCDRVIVMYLGKIVEQGITQDVLRTPQHEYTKRLLAAVPPAHTTLQRFPVDAQQQYPKIDIHNHWLGQQQHGKDPLLRVKNIDVRYTIQKSFFKKNNQYHYANRNVSFEINRGETFGIVGESGSGKSTIAKTIAGLTDISHGQVWFEDAALHALSHGARCKFGKAIQMIFQNPYASLNPRQRVGDSIAEPIHIHGLATAKQARQIVADLLNHLDIGQQAANRYPHEFSGGQQQRISIARALASRPQLLICDEPTSALDVSVQAQIINLLKDLQEVFGLTLLFISHDLPVIRQICQRIAVMRAGEIIEIADCEQLFSSPKHLYTKQLLHLMPSLD